MRHNKQLLTFALTLATACSQEQLAALEQRAIAMGGEDVVMLQAGDNDDVAWSPAVGLIHATPSNDGSTITGLDGSSTSTGNAVYILNASPFNPIVLRH